ncbi:MAG: dTDP-4-dehydrorhamnose 3,5-epimerase family protein [Burkholderiales bacterium]
MKLTELGVAGAYLIELEPITDARGEFVRLWDAEGFAEYGLGMHMGQVSAARNLRQGTLRGLHYQDPPHAETKIVRCIAGALFDVIADLRPGSPTYLRHECIEMSQRESRALWIPKGCAHGYQTLADETCVEYFIDAVYKPEYARGIRYDDITLGIQWPLPVTSISDRDRGFPPLVPNTPQTPRVPCASRS